MTDRATEQERKMQKEMERERNIETVARAAVYLLGLAEEDGDVVKIPLEHWNNYKAVITAVLLKKPEPPPPEPQPEPYDPYRENGTSWGAGV